MDLLFRQGGSSAPREPPGYGPGMDKKTRFELELSNKLILTEVINSYLISYSHIAIQYSYSYSNYS